MKNPVTNTNFADYTNSPHTSSWRNTARLLIGGSLVGVGLMRRSKLGVALAAIGGGIASIGYLPLAGDESAAPPVPRKRMVRRTVTIGKPQEEVYDFWAKPENLQRILPGVESIEPIGEGKWRWTFRPVGPTSFNFETEAVVNEPPDRMSWKSVQDSPLEHAGSIVFSPAPGGGTETQLTMSWIAKKRVFSLLPPALGKLSGWHAAESLRRSKQLLETGVLSTAEDR